MPKILDKKVFRNIDWVIVICILLLFCIGVVSIINATATPYTGEDMGFIQKLINSDSTLATRQLVFFAAGIVIMFLTLLIDYQSLKDYTPFFYWGSIIVVLMLYGYGTVTKNTMSWYKIGSLGLQPSELCKLATIMMLSKLLAERSSTEKIDSIAELIKPLIIVIIPFFLVYQQGDLGTALVYFFFASGIVLISGVTWKPVAMILLFVVIAAPIAYFFVFDEYQQNRILVFLNPEHDTSGAGYNVMFSKMAIGSGQLLGRGMFSEGGLAQLNWVPEKETDFIFTVIAETFGFIGGLVVIILYAVLIFRLLVIAMRTRDKFGSLVCVGVVCMIMFHVFENIGMCMGLMPVTGIPLPFISYGGSNLLTNMLSFGIILDIAARGQRRT